MSAKKKKAPPVKITKTGEFTYQFIDPVKGGTWVYGAQSEKEDGKILQHVISLGQSGKATRPGKGEVRVIHSLD